MKHALRIYLTLGLAALVLVACSGTAAGPSPPSDAAVSVVATSTVFADLVKQVGGDLVSVHSLVPKGGEVHTFDPAPSDAAAVSEADLLVMNGLGLDDWLVPFAQQAGADSLPILVLGEGIDEVEYIDDAATGQSNPHLWMNVAYARIYVDRIRLKLIELDPSGQETYDANVAAYDSRLQDLDSRIRDDFGAIPESNRRVVSFHDAFPYFADAYGLEIIGVVVPAPGQDPSAADIASLVRAIQDADAKAILAEVQFSDELVQTISTETGATVVSDLYTDSLGDPPVDSYEGAIGYDAEQITAALTE